MALDKPHLLIIDDSPEGAESINSMLRNSGINIRTKHANSITAIKSSVTKSRPFLVVYNETARETVPAVKVLKLAEDQGLNICIRFSTENPASFLEAMAFYRVLAVNADEDQQLISLVNATLEQSATESKMEGVSNRLDELQSRYQLLLDSSREATAYIHEGLHTYANKAYLDLLGVGTVEEIAAVSLLELMSSKSNDLKKLLRDMNNSKYPDGAIAVSLSPPGGNSIEAELVFSPARFEGEECIQVMVREVDANTVLKGELDRLRRTDPVTRLANRQTFGEILTQHLENLQGTDGTSAVFYLEADDIPGLRSTLGPSAWDEFMLETAKLIQAALGEGDIAARFNDNGFSVLLSRQNKGDLNTAVNNLVVSLGKEVIKMQKHTLSITCSIGYSIIGSHSNNIDEIITHALEAFEQASAKGNCAHEFKPQLELNETSGDDQQWVERLRYAMDNNDLYSVQQSIVNLEGETEGLFENCTYIREDEADIPADQFMPIAERNDLGATIDRHVIQGLMKAISGTGDRHIINLSMNSLLDFSFPSWFIHQLEENDVQGSQLVLQLPASVVEANLKPANRLIEELNSCGCGVSLSSFDDQRKICSLLDHLDVSLIKLRSGLTENLTNNTAHQTIVSNVVHAADQKQISVIADGIKDAADLAVLWQCGVKLVAGDFLKESPQVVGQ